MEAVSAQDVPLDNSSLSGVQCTCNHLTVFALLLRANLQQEALCQAEVQDYFLIALYALIMSVALIQVYRLTSVKSYEISLTANDLDTNCSSTNRFFNSKSL